MPTTLSFLRDPDYGASVMLFVLSPAGVTYEAKEIGRNLYGKRDFEIEPITIPGLAPRNGFRFSEIPVHWTDFLALSFSHADHALFYIPGKKKFQEISKEGLLQQNPDLYSFSFYRFSCEDYVPEAREEERIKTAPHSVASPPATVADSNASTGGTAVLAQPDRRAVARTENPGDQLREAQDALKSLIDAGWSANAISRVTGISPITLGSIRKGSQGTVSDRVHDTLVQLDADFASGKVGNPSRGKGVASGASQSASGTKRTESTAGASRTAVSDGGSRYSAPAPKDAERRGAGDTPRYIAVDAGKLESLLNRLITTFSDAIDDLRKLDGATRKQESEL